ncbi:MAG: response regulator, partial [Deltaproteobacteria bacterium]|nr:response regulator [Deltaproteobacteria bacterium]
EPFDLILTDVQMPKINGFDLASQVKTIPSLKEIPIIILTSTGRIGDGKRCREIGIEGYLNKPIKRDELRKAIVSVLNLCTMMEFPDNPKLITRHTIAEAYRKDFQILLVEDYPTNQQVAIRHLQDAGYQVDLAENGRQAIKAFKRKHYHLILMDIQMPEMDGIEATKKIRELEGNLNALSSNSRLDIPRIPIIAMTAHALKGDREKCLEAGMDDYISKPLQRKSFLEIVDKWVMPDSLSSDEPPAAALEPAPQADSMAEVTQLPLKRDSDLPPPINLKRAIAEFDGDREFVVDLLMKFIDKVKSQLEIIDQAIIAGNADVVAREAHSIKGGAGNLTSGDLSQAALELELIGKAGDLSAASSSLEKVRKEFHRLDDYARDRI